MYNQPSHDIYITVEPNYLDYQSDPEESRYVWAYSVRIENQGAEPVQLLRRFWRITDARGAIKEVRGDGVVGEQPVLKPGGSFEYTSGTPLSTPSGIMVGAYEMQFENGRTVDVDIPAFSLDSPHEESTVN